MVEISDREWLEMKGKLERLEAGAQRANTLINRLLTEGGLEDSLTGHGYQTFGDNYMDEDGIVLVGTGSYGDSIEWKIGSTWVGSVYATSTPYLYLQANGSSSRGTLGSNYGSVRLGSQNARIGWGNDVYLDLPANGQGSLYFKQNGPSVSANSAGDLLLAGSSVGPGDVKIGGVAVKPETLIVKSADEAVTSSTTLQNDDDFSFTVAANTSYVVEGVLIVDGSSSGDFKAAWSIPSGNYMISFVHQSSSTPGSIYEADQDQAEIISLLGVGTYEVLRIFCGLVIGGSGGTATLQ